MCYIINQEGDNLEMERKISKYYIRNIWANARREILIPS